MSDSKPKVFVSSTCFDLIDLRAEVEAELKLMGCAPIMSDRQSAEFEVSPDANSIQTCLNNIQNADYVIIILSQRYGPSLKDAGFEDVSATHLEYREARRFRRPILFYVRDRLESDFAIWKRNKGKPVNLLWVKPNDQKLFLFLEEHRKLAKSRRKSNWIWTFRDSNKLKQRLRKDLQVMSGKAILADLIRDNKMAFLVPQVDQWELLKSEKELHAKVSVSNAGMVAALFPFVTFTTGDEEITQRTKTLLPGESDSFEFKFKAPDEQTKEFYVFVECNYSLPSGHYIGDCSNIVFFQDEPWKDGGIDSCHCEFETKRYLHDAGFELKTRDEDTEPSGSGDKK